MYDGSTSRLNLMNACYALGAVLFPLLVGFTTQSGISWKVPAGIVAGLGFVLIALGCFIRLPEEDTAAVSSGKDRTSKDGGAFLKEISFYLCFATLFIYVGTETAASSWLSSYLSQYNTFFAENVPSETMVSLMWGMLLVGRVLFAAFGAKIDRRILLVALSTGFLVGLLGVTLLASSTPLAILSVVVLGLSMSAMYATGISNASRYVTGSPIAAGIIFGAGGVGSSLLPLIAGLFSDAISLKAGMLSLCAFLVLLVLTALVNLRTARKG